MDGNEVLNLLNFGCLILDSNMEVKYKNSKIT